MSVFLMIAVLLVTAGMFLLPLIPSFRELRRPADNEAMGVNATARQDTRYFAWRFRSVLEQHCHPLLAGVRNVQEPIEGEFPQGDRYIMTPGGERFAMEQQERDTDGCARIVVGAGDLTLGPYEVYRREIYSAGSLRVGEGTRLRAAYAEANLYLGRHVASDRWLHSEQVVHVSEGCAVYGRLSAEDSIQIQGVCGFERMRAPEIALGEQAFDDGWRPNRTVPEDVDVTVLPGFVSLSAGRAVFSDSLLIGPDAFIAPSLVVRGDLEVLEGSSIQGSIKVYGNLRLGDGVRIDGSVVCIGSVEAGIGCRIRGPILVDEELRLGPRTQVGELVRPTTVRARVIELSMGCQLHGTVWATERGEVVPREPA